MAKSRIDPLFSNPLLDVESLHALSDKRAAHIMRALNSVLADSGMSNFFSPRRYVPTPEEVENDQPPPPGLDYLDTIHVKVFDLVEDAQFGEIDQVLREVGLPLRSDRVRKMTPCRMMTDAHLPALKDYPGYVAFTGGDGTFLAREALKRLGAFWRPQIQWEPFKKGVWVVPAGRAEEAFLLVQEAERAEKEPGTSPAQAGASIPKLRCFECGTEYPLDKFLRRPGANAADWYCGCAEPTSRKQSKS